LESPPLLPLTLLISLSFQHAAFQGEIAVHSISSWRHSVSGAFAEKAFRGYEPGPTNHVLVPAATNSPSNAECYVIKIQHSINSYY
jgi:hypothetical protein